MNILYREAVGALMWASTMTRPDIANAFRNVARYRENSWGQHWTAVMKMFEYLRNKPERGLTCGRGNLKMTVAAYTDADYATDLDARCSLSWEVMLRGAAISWFSRMQRETAQSSAEVDDMPLAEVAREPMNLRQVQLFMVSTLEKY